MKLMVVSAWFMLNHLSCLAQNLNEVMKPLQKQYGLTHIGSFPFDQKVFIKIFRL